MLIIRTGKLNGTYRNESFIFDDAMTETEIVEKVEQLVNQLDVFNPTINFTFDTDEYEEHQQLFIKAFQETFPKTSLYRLNLITMSGFRQDAIIFDPHFINKIITVPLTK